MPYYKRPIIYPSGKIRQDTAKINENFTELAKAFLNEDPTTGIVANADKVDNFHASRIPSPDTIPVAGPDRKLHPGWLPTIDADTLDGFHASQTPAPNTIPVAGPDGKLNPGWLSVSGGSGGGSNVALETCSKFYVEPLTERIFHNNLRYNRDTNKLYKYDGITDTWIEIDWRKFVYTSPEWRYWWGYNFSRFRINDSTGALEIKVGNNWIQCVPVVGSPVIWVDNTYTILENFFYWIPPGQTVYFYGAFYYLPIVFFGEIDPVFSLSVINSHHFSSTRISLVPSGIYPTETAGQFLEVHNNNIRSFSVTNCAGVPVMYITDYSSSFRCSVEIKITSTGFFYVDAIGSGSWSTAITICSSYCRLPSNAFWLGMFADYVYGSSSYVSFCSVTRRA